MNLGDSEHCVAWFRQMEGAQGELLLVWVLLLV